jgi:hypothetical protein
VFGKTVAPRRRAAAPVGASRRSRGRLSPVTRTRYLALTVAPPAFLVNVAVNLVAGRAVYPQGAMVPMLGDKSVGGDTLVGAFLIGLFTLLAVRPTARKDARLGRVAGLGRTSSFATWFRRHFLVGPWVFAFACLLVLGAPTVAGLAWAHPQPIGRDTFLLVKCAFAGVTGVGVALVAAWLGLLPEADVTADRRWCRRLDPAHVSYPFDYVDKGGLAVTSAAHGCSGTPIWQLVVTGALDEAHVRTALADLVTRYPSLTTRVRALDGAPPLARLYRYVQDPTASPDALLHVVDLRSDASSLPSLEQALHDRPLDLFSDPPVTITLVHLAGGARLYVRQHHAIADGRAVIELLGDFGRFLEAARHGRRPGADELTAIGRLHDLDALGLEPRRRLRFTLAGYWLLTKVVVRGLLRPAAPLLQNRSNDYTGENGVIHWRVDQSTLAHWDAARKRRAVSLNSLLTAALFEANRRWHAARGLPLGRVTGNITLETRPRDRPFRSFANHLATLELDLRLDQLTSIDALATAIQAQVKAQRAASLPEKRLLCERQLVLGMPLEALQAIVFQSKHPAYNLTFSNLIPLDFPPIGGAGWRVDEVRVCTPVTPRIGIALTVIRYRGQLCFNFNYKASAISREETEALRAAFEETLGELDCSTLSAPARHAHG